MNDPIGQLLFFYPVTSKDGVILYYEHGICDDTKYHRLWPSIKKGFATMRFEHFTMFDLSKTPPELIRHDYSLADIRNNGGGVPKLYLDELGNIRGENDEIVFQGPNNAVLHGMDQNGHPIEIPGQVTGLVEQVIELMDEVGNVVAPSWHHPNNQK